MAIYYFNHQGNALLHGYVWQSNQSSMWNVVQMYQLPEVRIDRDQYPALCSCEFQQSPIPWIGAKIPGVHNVMSITAKPLCKTATGAPVYEESHELVTDIAARESPAITACA